VSVRKRAWLNRDGSQGEAWVVAYTDQTGVRRIKTFDRKKDADAFHAVVGVDVRKGIHVPDSQSITVAEAAELWLESGEAEQLERSTLDSYRDHVTWHLTPLLGAIKLSQLSIPMVRHFEDTLRKNRSPAMVRKVRSSLGAILADAQERGLVARNVVRDLRGHRSRRKKGSGKRQDRRLQVGVDIPTPEEVRALLQQAEGHWRPFLMTAVFTGLRSSELRGLRWQDVDLEKGELHVRQRADRYNEIGRPKSAAGTRTVPLPPALIHELRQWKLGCPKRIDQHDKIGKLVLVFPNGRGNIENNANLRQRGLVPAMLCAKVTRPVLDRHGHPKRDSAGKPLVQAKYSGLHALRHFYASWCINRKVDGGLELPAKVVQERLGHASIVMTMDTYGHLFPRNDDGTDLAAAASALLA